MRFYIRGLSGLLIFALTIGLLALGFGRLGQSMREREERAARTPAPSERVIAVTVAQLTRGPAHPVITAYGRVESRRMLELRAAEDGPVIELAEAFRDGGLVAADTLLVRIDPADAQSARDAARASLAEARAELAEAQAVLTHARDDLAAAQAQHDLRAQALTRQEELLGRRVSTDATVENARISLSAAQQALIGSRQSLSAAEARILRNQLAVDRGILTLADAERDLAETEIAAPFTGLITDVAAVLGRRVAVNEVLGKLVDLTRMEVAFRVSTAEFARLLDAGGRLRAARITAVLDLGGRPLAVEGTLNRAGAMVDEGQTGRLLYGTLELDADTVLRPGDFLTVAITEPAMSDVAVLPATAVTEDGRLLLVTEEDRLREVTLPILRRQGETVILGDAPEGARYVVARLPTLGAGIKIRPVSPDDTPQSAEMVVLSPSRRAALIAAIEANTGMPEEARARILARLQEDKVPRALLDRLTARGQDG
ncbi:MAG: HlyD family efflux transporter periplasmic adaptor subunit [Pseudomonadota bacterium]